MALTRLVAAAQDMGLELSEDQLEQFEGYRRELLEWNQRFNLTAIRDPDQIESKHFLDSLACLRLDIPELSRVLDVGAGAGLPGLPMKIARPDIKLTLLEATQKKARFLEHVASTLGLTAVEVVALRAEEFTARESFDLVVARAVAALPSLLELTLPFCRIGGRVVAMKKGEGLEAEVAAAAHALKVLGGRLVDPIQYEVDGEARQLLVVEKIGRYASGVSEAEWVTGQEPTVDIQK